jgi:hypothetical protein
MGEWSASWRKHSSLVVGIIRVALRTLPWKFTANAVLFVSFCFSFYFCSVSLSLSSNVQISVSLVQLSADNRGAFVLRILILIHEFLPI